MKNKAAYALIIIILMTAGLAMLMDRHYLYSPLEYEGIANFDQVRWHDFKRPILMELEIKDPQIVEYLLQNEQEIKFIFDKLVEGEPIAVSEYAGDRYVLFQFARGNLTDASFEGFFTVEINRQGIAKLNEDLYLQVSDELMAYFARINKRDTVSYLLGAER